jgi:hypothetical protein
VDYIEEAVRDIDMDLKNIIWEFWSDLALSVNRSVAGSVEH